MFYYYAACAYATNKNINQALKSLEGAIESGLNNPERFLERLKTRLRNWPTHHEIDRNNRVFHHLIFCKCGYLRVNMRINGFMKQG